MDASFGNRLNSVRVHADAEAGRLNADLAARAFTVGSHVFFGAGQFRPSTQSGERLLAHELAHTVQSTGDAPTVRRTLDEAKNYASTNGIPGIVTSADVADYINDRSQPMARRQQLLAAHDDGLSDDQKLKLTVEPDATASVPSLVVVPLPGHDPEAAAQAMAKVIMNLDIAAIFLKKLRSEDLLAFASTAKVTMGIAQDFARLYLPAYEDRFQFHLATKGRLLVEPLEEKWGGKKHEGRPHATSGWKWYQAGRIGAKAGPIVLGAIPDYREMRDYTTYMRDEKGAKTIEENARYLMAYPWSLLVNAALLTGAIHARRTVIGATDPLNKEKLWGKQYGVTVYGRELIQLVLQHGYLPGEQTGLQYPEPAVSGGIALHAPTLDPDEPGRPATIFDAETALKDNPKYQEASLEGTTLVDDLAGKISPTSYSKIVNNPKQLGEVENKKKQVNKRYVAFRKTLGIYHTDGVPKPGINALIAEVLEDIYHGKKNAMVAVSPSELEGFIAKAHLGGVKDLDKLPKVD